MFQVLNVAHLMMNRHEVLMGNLCAHLDAHIITVVERVSTRVAHHLPAVWWFLQHGFFPKDGRHWSHSQWLKEVIAHIEHSLDCVFLVLNQKYYFVQSHSTVLLILFQLYMNSNRNSYASDGMGLRNKFNLQIFKAIIKFFPFRICWNY